MDLHVHNKRADAFVGRFLGGLLQPFLLSQDVPVSVRDTSFGFGAVFFSRLDCALVI